MSENVITRPTSGFPQAIYWTRYTRSEIRKAWSSEGQGHAQAMQRGRWCVVLPITDRARAEAVAALFVREVFAIPTCTHWDGETLSLYCGDAGHGASECMRRAGELESKFDRHGGLDEMGPLFATDS